MKKFFAILLGFLILLMSTGCSKSNNRKTGNANKIVNKFIRDQQNLEIEWDDDKKAVLLINKTSNKIWSTVSLNPLDDGNSSLMSPINIQVSNAQNFVWEIVNGYDSAIVNGKVTHEEIDNGLLVTYSFGGYGISVPIKYEIADGYMKTTVVTKNITEKEDYRLVSISLSPNLCSVANSENNDSYLFLPVGSGALMSTKEDANGKRNFSGEVYGCEYAGFRSEYLTDEENIRMPVFGVKDRNDALFCIIDEPVGNAELNAEAGDPSTGKSRIYPKIYIRGYDVFPVTEQKKYLGGSEYTIIAEDKTETSPSVIYCPMSGENSDYNGMAMLYKDYLLSQNILSKSDLKSSSFSLSIYGGTQVTEVTMGIPHTSTNVLTTYDYASNIVDDYSKDSEFLPSVRMLGFGESGINPGKVAGGFKLSNLYGSKSDLNDLMAMSSDKGVLLSWDFDLVRFNSSGNGFSSLSNTAKTANNRVATVYPIQTPDRTNITNKQYYLLSRTKTASAVNKLIKYLNKEKIDSVSLFTLTEMAYSDFSSNEYYSKNNMEDSVGNCIQNFLDNKIDVVSGPNIYAALKSDAVYDVPIDSGNYNVFSATVPFYQMVFHGYKPLYSTALNTQGNLQLSVVKALSSGTNMSFSLIEAYDTKYQTTDVLYLESGAAKLYSLVYQYNKERIDSVIEKYKDIYSEIATAEIVSFEWENKDVSITKFSNGKTIYANHSQHDVNMRDFSLEPYSVKLMS